MTCFDDDYLLTSKVAKRIYSDISRLPIYDFHSHLSPKEIAEDIEYDDIYELWLTADHYKWRLMRMAGVNEHYITGDASPYEKFCAFASILPLFVGNPVYEWAHLELRRYFDMDIAINKDNADHIWNVTRDIIRERHYSPRQLLSIANVDTLMTTDDPLDSLKYHKYLSSYSVKVLPTFRADKVLMIGVDNYLGYIHNLEQMTDTSIVDIDSLMDALEIRLEYFVLNGAVISDISIGDIPPCGALADANIAIQKALYNRKLNEREKSSYMYHVLLRLASLFCKYDIVMQLHIGAMRNNNTTRYNMLGGDSGIDSIGGVLSIDNLRDFLDALESQYAMPRSIYYTHNENAYYILSTMLGNFAGGIRGKLQLGAAWWMMDSKEGIRRQLEVFKNTAGLGYFNGMLTDSRSFTSFVRHDYFRRILADMLGDMVTSGSVAFDEQLLEMAENISYNNAKNFIGRSLE